ncbi:MAG: PmbA/TldA family metallopeptidase, partial [Quisquiliibacterium sp.]
MFDYSPERLHEIAADVLKTARNLGASSAAVDISEASGLSVNVRMGHVETIEQTRDKGVGVTVYLGHKRGHASTSDFSPKALHDAVDAAYQIARHTGDDDCAGLPDPETLATEFPDLDLFHRWDISVEDAIALGKRMEAAAFATSPLIR